MVDAESGGSETSRHNLLKQLREGSEFLEYQKDDLSYIWKKYSPNVLSFYETVPTAAVSKVTGEEFPLLLVDSKVNLLQTDTGAYARNGEESLMVQRLSAQLYIPNEIRQPVEEDHSNMVKFNSAEDPNYRTTVRYLNEWVDSTTKNSGK
jgi:hypothetical protein